MRWPPLISTLWRECVVSAVWGERGGAVAPGAPLRRQVSMRQELSKYYSPVSSIKLGSNWTAGSLSATGCQVTAPLVRSGLNCIVNRLSVIVILDVAWISLLAEARGAKWTGEPRLPIPGPCLTWVFVKDERAVGTYMGGGSPIRPLQAYPGCRLPLAAMVTLVEDYLAGERGQGKEERPGIGQGQQPQPRRRWLPPSQGAAQRAEGYIPFSSPANPFQLRNDRTGAGGPSFSDLVSPIANLTRKDASDPVQWMEWGQRVFEQVKQALCGEPLLHTPNFSLPFYIVDRRIEQKAGGRFVPGGRGCRPSDTLWPHQPEAGRPGIKIQYHREGMVIQWAVGSLRYYLLGRSFSLCLDHAPLQCLHHMKDANTRITRISPYSLLKFRVVHRCHRWPWPTFSLALRRGEGGRGVGSAGWGPGLSLLVGGGFVEGACG